jgi:hypothetical protein
MKAEWRVNFILGDVPRLDEDGATGERCPQRLKQVRLVQQLGRHGPRRLVGHHNAAKPRPYARSAGSRHQGRVVVEHVPRRRAAQKYHFAGFDPVKHEMGNEIAVLERRDSRCVVRQQRLAQAERGKRHQNVFDSPARLVQGPWPPELRLQFIEGLHAPPRCRARELVS